MQTWAAAFNAPVYLNIADREWVMRGSPPFSSGKGMRWNYSVSHPCCVWGHFAGGTVLHWQEGEGVLLAGDILQVTPGKDAVSFMELPEYAAAASPHR